MDEEFRRPLGRILIEERMRQLGINFTDLCNKVYGPQGSKSKFLAHMNDPMKLTLREVRAVSACLSFTADEIYRSFILLEGWPNDKVLQYNNGRYAKPAVQGSTKSGERVEKGDEGK